LGDLLQIREEHWTSDASSQEDEQLEIIYPLDHSPAPEAGRNSVTESAGRDGEPTAYISARIPTARGSWGRPGETRFAQHARSEGKSGYCSRVGRGENAREGGLAKRRRDRLTRSPTGRSLGGNVAQRLLDSEAEQLLLQVENYQQNLDCQDNIDRMGEARGSVTALAQVLDKRRRQLTDLVGANEVCKGQVKTLKNKLEEATAAHDAAASSASKAQSEAARFRTLYAELQESSVLRVHELEKKVEELKKELIQEKKYIERVESSESAVSLSKESGDPEVKRMSINRCVMNSPHELTCARVFIHFISVIFCVRLLPTGVTKPLMNPVCHTPCDRQGSLGA
jgi:hypothetical protein